MASSNNSKTENKKKTKNAETSKSVNVTKVRKERDSEKKNTEKNKKKLNLSNGNLKQRHDKPLIAPCSSSKFKQHDQKQEEKEENTVVTNGRTSGTKPKKPKRKQEEHEKEEDAKTLAFPINRIRTMIKGEDPDLRVSQEALLAINKAAEKFLEQFTQDAYTCCVQERKKSLSYKYLELLRPSKLLQKFPSVSLCSAEGNIYPAHIVSKERRYDFLSDFVPGQVKADDALRERNSEGNGGG